jgi:hypothetical protein
LKGASSVADAYSSLQAFLDKSDKSLMKKDFLLLERVLLLPLQMRWRSGQLGF